ncbi:MAG: sensor histidine kinase [Nitrospiraceae bacterium]|nr:sensor histidine kinase [Nitrospiraceae bacterium]
MMEKDSNGLRLIHGSDQKKRDIEHPSPVSGSRTNSIMRQTPRSSSDLIMSLRATEARLSSLLEDRNRISRDLHDSVLQSLYAIGLNLEASHRTNTAPRPRGDRSYGLAVDQLNRLIHEVRGIIKGLADGSVQDMDLSEELRQLAGSYEQLGSITITLSLQSSALDILTREEEREILNIVREALSNCVRHAQATHAEVTIRTHGNRVRISICDDGKGLVETGMHPKGYGLMNMEARAKKLGGSLLLRSKLGQGTRITAEFLLEPILAPV